MSDKYQIILREIINDSFMANTHEFDQEYIILVKDIRDLFPLIKNFNSVVQLYNNYYEFSDEKLLILAEDIKYLGSKRILEVLVLIKSRDTEGLLKNRLSKYMLNDYDNIITYFYYHDIAFENTLLKIAIYYGLLNIVKYMIRRNILDLEKSLSWACQHGQLEIFEHLVTLTLNSSWKPSCLKFSCMNGHFEIFEIVFDMTNSKVLSGNNNYLYFTLIGYACSIKNDKMLKLIFTKINSKDIKKVFVEYCRHIVRMKNLDLLELMLTFDDTNSTMYLRTESYETCIDYCWIEGIEYMLTKYYDANWLNYEMGLELAISARSYEIVKLFLDKGANISSLYNNTNLFDEKCYDILVLLIEKGFDLNKIPIRSFVEYGRDGKYSLKLIQLFVEKRNDKFEFISDILTCACSNGQFDIVKYLISNGANIHHLQNEQFVCACITNCLNKHTPKSNNIEIIKFLIDSGANIQANNNKGIISACQVGNLEIVKLLLDSGINVHIHDDLLLQISSERGHIEVVQLLIDRGANVQANSNHALKLATRLSRHDIIKLLKEHGANF